MRKQKMECSKKILLIAAITFATVILFTFLMIWRTGDLSPLAYLIPSVGGVVTTGVGFYYWKAKQENVIKLRREEGVSAECVAEDFDAGGFDITDSAI